MDILEMVKRSHIHFFSAITYHMFYFTTLLGCNRPFSRLAESQKNSHNWDDREANLNNQNKWDKN